MRILYFPLGKKQAFEPHAAEERLGRVSKYEVAPSVGRLLRYDQHFTLGDLVAHLEAQFRHLAVGLCMHCSATAVA